MSLVIGLTGGIASGKSAVATMLKEKGIPVVDADAAAREVVEVGHPTYEKIISEFGSGILNDDRTLNRIKLGNIIFKDQSKRQLLNSIMHPSIRSKMKDETKQYIEQGYQVVVMDIPLLFESKLTHLVEKTLVIYVDEEIQLQRLMKRNQLKEEDARARIESQMPLKEKVELADAVIDNTGGLEETEAQLNTILMKWDIQK